MFRPVQDDDGSVTMTVEEQIAKFEEDIGLRPAAGDQQRNALREDMIRRGIDPDVTPDVEMKQEWWKGDDGFAGWEDADLNIEM